MVELPPNECKAVAVEIVSIDVVREIVSRPQDETSRQRQDRGVDLIAETLDELVAS